MKTNRITKTALLTGIALIIHVLEAQLPPIVPVPGVKLGLANVVTLLSLYMLSPRETVLVVACRLLLGSFFSGGWSQLMYAAAGSLLSLCVMIPLCRITPPKYMFLPSVLSAAAHNLGQLMVAVLVTCTPALFMYLPILTVSGCAAGLFTGLCAAAVYDRFSKTGKSA